MKYISKTIKDTEKIAKDFIGQIFENKPKTKGALVIGLSGDLGAGKTAFTQAVLKHLGVKSKVTSPTFVVMKKYPIGKTYGVRPHPSPLLAKERGLDFKFFFHIDAYRLKNEQELLVLKWAEILNNPEHIIFIEWPENVIKAIPKHTKLVYISTDENGHRNFKFDKK